MQLGMSYNWEYNIDNQSAEAWRRKKGHVFLQFYVETVQTTNI